MKRYAFEGSWNELLSHVSEFAGQQLRVTILAQGGTRKQRPTGYIKYGMFPKLKNLSEEDFKKAEWHGPQVDF